jgi:uncharacterized membrane protein
MESLTVWRFDTPHGAGDVLASLERLAGDGDLSLVDAALVRWPPGQRKPAIEALGGLTVPGELWSGFWGLVLALLFVTPIAGPTFGAGAGAVAASLTDFGVGDDFVKRVRDAVTPGTSALFVVSDAATADRLAAELAGVAAATIRADLSDEQRRRLHEALGDEPTPRIGR